MEHQNTTTTKKELQTIKKIEWSKVGRTEIAKSV